MKANETPGKIYMTPSFGEPDNVLLASFSKSHLDFHRDIEYTQTDSFIDKACKFLKDKGNEYIAIVDGQLVLRKAIIKDFKNYMKED